MDADRERVAERAMCPAWVAWLLVAAIAGLLLAVAGLAPYVATSDRWYPVPMRVVIAAAAVAVFAALGSVTAVVTLVRASFRR